MNRTSFISRTAIFVFLVLLLARVCAASDVAVLDGCVDGTGRAVPVEADYGQVGLVQTIRSGNQPTIRYNPTVLPYLDPTSRMFFYAQACAQVAAGMADKTLTVAAAHALDCVALRVLLDAEVLKPDQVSTLQAQLVFNEEEWRQLPGPARNIAFGDCRKSGNVLRLPVASPPSLRQADWNACIRVCGDRLWTCQKPCKGGACENACMQTQRDCEAACGSKPD